MLPMPMNLPHKLRRRKQIESEGALIPARKVQTSQLDLRGLTSKGRGGREGKANLPPLKFRSGCATVVEQLLKALLIRR